MDTAAFYPVSPDNVPGDLTKASASYKRHAWLAMFGLVLFIVFYYALMAGFAYITYIGAMAFQQGSPSLAQMVITVSSALLTVFMAKSLFVVRRAGDPGGVEVKEADEPKLFAFLNKLSDEIGAPRPHRVFITPDVNAAVFYDLSLLNLIFPSKKNLIIGLGLVNTLNLGEMKAVLAHEFGHFAQGSMVVGRWVYIAQQIIAHMVATRDWLDSIVKFVSRIDLRIAWIGWLLSLIIWSIRSLMDTLFNVVIMAERALSREMEFNADLVAVSVTGSDALINALYKLQAADHAWQTALDVASREAGEGHLLEDLFHAQKVSVAEMRRVLNDDSYGKTPVPPKKDKASYRVFTKEAARPPQMWATHPANSDREENAKERYIDASIDKRDAWELFNDPVKLRQAISKSFYNEEKASELSAISPLEAVIKRFNKPTYAPEFRGTYLNRSPMQGFKSVAEVLSAGSVEATPEQSLAALYPESLQDDLETARNLDIERQTLEALANGELKPSGGVIRHRGEELRKSDIPDAIEEIVKERQAIAQILMEHDASCRRAHLQAAEVLGNGWKDYLQSLIQLLHCSEHLLAIAENEYALMVNTWMVITADGQIGHFEKKRMLRVCNNLHETMTGVSEALLTLQLPANITEELGVENWDEQCPVFELVAVDGKNWPQWCQAADETLRIIINALQMIQDLALNKLIEAETTVKKHYPDGAIEQAPAPGACPQHYPVLLPGEEHQLQRKLDLWNRFQLAHGVMPTLARLLVSTGIVGGTIYGGLVFV